MPRPMYGGRTTPPISIAADVQRIINAQPTTCVVKRRTSASTGKNVTFATLPEFQCRIDPVRLRMSANTEGVSEAGFADANIFVLVALYGTDIFGATVDIRHRDQCTIDGLPYLCTNVNSFPTYGKVEAILEFTG